jgi:hypothetical protein
MLIDPKPVTPDLEGILEHLEVLADDDGVFGESAFEI